jgi:DNA-binding beta-propeller fold protein YncE
VPDPRSRGRLARTVALVLLVPALLVVACVGAGAYLLFGGRSGPSPPRPLASIDLPAQPLALAWSPDGAYLAGGVWGGLPPHTGGAEYRGAVYLIDPEKRTLVATLDLPNYVRAVAFSPDGKWLAVGTCHPPIPGADPPPPEVLVCDVPGLAVKFRAAAGDGATAVLDLAWAPDGWALYAVEGESVMDHGTAVRGWTVPGWVERPAFTNPRTGGFNAVAVAPGGKAVAVADQKGLYDPLTLRLYDPTTAAEVRSFETPLKPLHPRLAFDPDGKAVAVADGVGIVSWFDRAAGGSTTPAVARLAFPPAAQADYLVSRAVPADLSRVAAGEMNRMKLIDFFPGDKYGAFVAVTAPATSQTWKWRLADEYGHAPAVAFSPDGSKLATTTGHAGGGAVQIWATPK